MTFGVPVDPPALQGDVTPTRAPRDTPPALLYSGAMSAPSTRLALLFVLLAACTPAVVLPPSSGSDVPPVDASVDVASDATPALDRELSDVPSIGDIGTTTCVDDTPCRAAGNVCDRVRGRCVECVSPDDCGGSGRSCRGSRCVPAVTCTTSRMCPGQVCDPTRGFCVDCNADPDCADGTVCRSNACVPPPRTCRSSRECSDLMLVCDTARGQCVECASDVDCADGLYCTAGAICRPRVCTPAAIECLDARRARRCDARGSAWVEQTCGASESCSAGRCVSRTCTPGAMRCEGATGVAVCNDDGLGSTTTACPADRSCRDGACVTRVCSPGASTCVDARVRRVCGADGLATTNVSCGERAGCVMGACVPWTCTPGAVECASGTASRVCSADGQGYTTRPCESGQSCRDGACRAWACTPGSSTCRDLATMNVCAADGSGSSPVACAVGSSCTGGMCSGWICSPGARRCSGASSVETCRSDGLGYGAASACPVPANATAASCAAGVCAFTCAAGFADCNGVASDGCEVDTRGSVSHCGRCGNACTAGSNATATCTAGACGSRCADGFGDCDSAASNGCETALSSTTNCGRCGNVCPSGGSATATCSAGTCGLQCSAGYNRCGNGSCVANVAAEACNNMDDDCDGAVDEGCGNGTCGLPYVAAPAGGRFTGNMNGAGTHSATCGASSNSRGVERIWRWTPSRSGTATVRLTGDFWPATLYVRQTSCDTGSQVACDSQAGSWPTENVSLTVTAGTTYYVFVDCQYNGTMYNPAYDLTITAP